MQKVGIYVEFIYSEFYKSNYKDFFFSAYWLFPDSPSPNNFLFDIDTIKWYPELI